MRKNRNNCEHRADGSRLQIWPQIPPIPFATWPCSSFRQEAELTAPPLESGLALGLPLTCSIGRSDILQTLRGGLGRSYSFCLWLFGMLSWDCHLRKLAQHAEEWETTWGTEVAQLTAKVTKVQPSQLSRGMQPLGEPRQNQLRNCPATDGIVTNSCCFGKFSLSSFSLVH